ncbi:MAG: hypothetical protein N2712_01010 [Brevinematales bacterium]|nr:hypothetical protein [Brevinematales bacterium]
MKKIATLFTLVTVLLWISLITVSCSPSAGRKIIDNGKFDTELSIGGAFFYYTSIPLPLPNVGIGARHGVYQDLNIGIKIYPLSLLFNSLLSDVFVVGNIFKSDISYVPSINIYGQINILTYFGYFDMVFYPLVGSTGVWRFETWDIYLPFEISIDPYNPRISLKFNLGIGLNFRIFDKLTISPELRLNSIANIYLPLGSMVGIPVLFVSATYTF